LSSGAPQGSAEPSISPTNDGFTSLITKHIQQVDDEDDESLIAAPSTWKRLPVSQLFDFGSTHWSSRYAHFANITFEEELELLMLMGKWIQTLILRHCSFGLICVGYGHYLVFLKSTFNYPLQ